MLNWELQTEIEKCMDLLMKIGKQNVKLVSCLNAFNVLSPIQQKDFANSRSLIKGDFSVLFIAFFLSFLLNNSKKTKNK